MKIKDEKQALHHIKLWLSEFCEYHKELPELEMIVSASQTASRDIKLMREEIEKFKLERKELKEKLTQTFNLL